MSPERNVAYFLHTVWFLLKFCICFSPRMASGMQEKQYTPSLLSFFIYNPTFGPREGEVDSIWSSHFIVQFVYVFSIIFENSWIVNKFLCVNVSFLSGREEDFVLPSEWCGEEWEDPKCGPLWSHCTVY